VKSSTHELLNADVVNLFNPVHQVQALNAIFLAQAEDITHPLALAKGIIS